MENINASGAYNYGEALQKALLFYELQRSGKLPENKRTNWRGDSGLNDGADVGLDLTGGWYDAGDHVKFNLPMAYSAAMLAWSVCEDKKSYLASGQLPYILDSVRWANDYFIKCHPEPDVYYYQVGDGNADHAWWGPAEVMQMNRPAYKVDKDNPGSTVAAATAAALASCAAAFAEHDKDYAALCLKHAKELFDFAENTKSDSGYGAATGFYTVRDGFYDKLSFAAVWLYKASNDVAYLDKAKSYVKHAGDDYYKRMHCWNYWAIGAVLMLAVETGEPEYKGMIEKNLDFWTTGTGGERIHYTPKGLAWFTEWGSLRYACTAAFIAGIYSQREDCPADKKTVYWDFAVKQVNYVLGDSGRSFVCGFGDNPPVNPHHRTAQGSWSNNINEPCTGRHVLMGALVGGPGKNDNYSDDADNYVNNEVACDYNAGFVCALAKLYGVYGGAVIDHFGAYEEVPFGQEYDAEICVSSSGDNYAEMKAVVYNKTGWYARVADNLKLRCFIGLPEDAGTIGVDARCTQGGIAELKAWDKKIYCVELDLSGYTLCPGGSQYKHEASFRLTGSGGWDNAEQLGVALYEGDKLVYGKEP